MRWDLKRVELLASVLDELFMEWASGACIVVEGRRDKEVLESLGLRDAIAFKTLNYCMTDAIESLCRKDRVIILTDFDREGEELALRISKVLEKRGVRVNLDVRRRLAVILGGEVKGLEELGPLLDRISKQFEISMTRLYGYTTTLKNR